MTIKIALQRIAEAAKNNATKLNLSSLGLTEIPSEVFTLTSLECLSLANNQISVVPPEITLLPNLIEIDLAKNKFTSIPPIVDALHGTRSDFRSYFSDNDYSQERIAQALTYSFKDLDLTDCNLTEIPSGILALPNLESIDLSGNRIAHISPEIVARINKLLPNLNSICLNENCFKVFPAEVLSLTNLESISLMANEIETVSKELDFSQTPKLTEITLTDNPITKNPAEVSILDEFEVSFPNIEIWI